MNAWASRKTRRILLVFPGKYVGGGYKPSMPLSLIAIAAPLLASGFDVEIFDQRVQDKDRFLDRDFEEYLFVGLSSLTGNPIVYGLDLCSEIRRKAPSVPLVWGGVHPTLTADQTLSTSDLVDIIVRGEGEITVVALARALNTGQPLDSIEGLSFKQGGHIHHNPDRAYIDFDTVISPLPYHLVSPDLVDFDNDFLYQSARGCPFDCKFCDVIAFHSRETRQKSVEKVVQELIEIDRLYHPSRVEFVDDLFFIDLGRCEGIMRGLVEHGTKFRWTASCRANIAMKFSEDYLALMKRSGCNDIYVGAESGSPRILEYMSKRITPGQIADTVERLSRHGIQTTMNFMTGFPTETREDVQKTVDLVAGLESRYPRRHYIMGGINTYAPYPGSELHDEVTRLGFRDPVTFRDWGTFILNERRTMAWLPADHVDFIQRLAIVSRWRAADPGFRELFGALFKPRGIGAFVKRAFATLFAYRWRYQWYSCPIDIYAWAWITKRVMKQG